MKDIQARQDIEKLAEVIGVIPSGFRYKIPQTYRYDSTPYIKTLVSGLKEAFERIDKLKTENEDLRKHLGLRYSSGEVVLEKVKKR